MNRIVPLGERHLRRALAEYVTHYHGERNHQGLGNRLIIPEPTAFHHRGAVLRRQRLGGMLNYYYHPARRKILVTAEGSRRAIRAVGEFCHRHCGAKARRSCGIERRGKMTARLNRFGSHP